MNEITQVDSWYCYVYEGGEDRITAFCCPAPLPKFEWAYLIHSLFPRCQHAASNPFQVKYSIFSWAYMIVFLIKKVR